MGHCAPIRSPFWAGGHISCCPHGSGTTWSLEGCGPGCLRSVIEWEGGQVAAGWSWWPSRFPVLCRDSPLPSTVLGSPGPEPLVQGLQRLSCCSPGEGSTRAVTLRRRKLASEGGVGREGTVPIRLSARSHPSSPPPRPLRSGGLGSEQGVPSVPI